MNCIHTKVLSEWLDNLKLGIHGIRKHPENYKSQSQTEDRSPETTFRNISLLSTALTLV
jgi:hypothetical protein